MWYAREKNFKLNNQVTRKFEETNIRVPWYGEIYLLIKQKYQQQKHWI